MSAPESDVTIDPELQRQLGAAAASNQPVEVVVRLRPDDSAEIVPSPERTKELAEKVLKRVKKRFGNAEVRHNIFSNLGSLVVSGSPEFVRELISQPEVGAAVANQQPDSALMPPVEKEIPASQTRNKAASSPKKMKRAVSARRSAATHKSDR